MKGIRLLLLGVFLLSFPGPLASAGERSTVSEAQSARVPSIPALLPPWAQAFDQPPPPGVLEPALARALERASPGQTLRVIVVLEEQLSLPAMPPPAADALQRRARLVGELQSLAQRTQGPLRAYLTRAQAEGRAVSFRPFWIFNGLAVEARPAVIRALAADPSVATIRVDHYRRYLAAQPARQVADATPEWNLSRIRAPEVWAALQISGTGAVVAGMDTGVDWLHPDLQANYRGYNPHGVHVHGENWYDAVNGSMYPVDDNGHGTHTLGTAAGQGGIGVAPGARWIGVKTLSSAGYGYDSWIHAGFQWLLAPGGDPDKAPDVVNCSWSNTNGFLTTFQNDIWALRAAGIFPVFASGNNGPREGTVGSPASLPGAFAVGASDQYDQVARFSGRGPSPWGEIRPHIVAPGVSVRSALPGGLYGTENGTSMAAPHVAGVAALLRAISPSLTITRMAYVITSTAVPLSDSIPNNQSGWGRVDAFAAVAAVARPGFVTGTVRQAVAGAPVAGASVEAVPRLGPGRGTATTGNDGRYLLALAPATYDLTASAFGYAPQTASAVEVTAGDTTRRDFSLTALPTGTLQVQVSDAATAQPISATLDVLDTPLEASGSAHTFTLPAGVYTLSARRLGYRLVTTTVAITAGETTTASLALPPAPSILLVDSGGWYYDSQAAYFRQALDDLAYVYDELPIRQLPGDVPATSDLAPYDLVVWSAPWDSPGYIGAQDTVTGYLSAGGRLLLTGQDIGYLDGGGVGYFSYYPDYLKVSLAQDSSGISVLEGAAGDLFAGLTLTITGPGGADNQEYPDVINVRDPDSAVEVLAYRGDGCGGVRVGTCLDYRVVYLSFGFEAISSSAVRREVMDRALAWLVEEPPTHGLELTPGTQSRIGLPGDIVTHSLRLRHVGQAGVSDVFSLTLEGGSWSSTLSPSLSLAPCTSDTVVVSVTIPASAGWDAQDVMTLTARFALSPTLFETAVITTKSPAPVLLVDDDRWYEQLEKYEAAMRSAALPYDLWQIMPASGTTGDHSPTLERLSWYPVVVWWTGYDWYRPLTLDERTTLEAYLAGGGRLFLSSQDFLYYHGHSPLSRDGFGVLSYTQDVTPTVSRGAAGDLIGGGLGPWTLDYPFRNWSDAMEPAPGGAVSFRDQALRGIALNRRSGGQATVFFAYPFEALPEAERPEVMERLVGWLSWLGGSTFDADRGSVSAGEEVTYTLRVHNDGPTTATASVSNTLAAGLSFVPGSLSGPATYVSAGRRISWTGQLGSGAGVTVTYRAVVSTGLPAGAAVANVARIQLEEQSIHFSRIAKVRVDRPDLAPSVLACDPSSAPASSRVTCTVALTNAGPAAAASARITHPLPSGAVVVSGSLAWDGGGVAELPTDTLHWSGPLAAGGRVTVSYALTLPGRLDHPPLYGVAFIEDGVGGRWERSTWINLQTWRSYLPLVLRQG